MATSSQDPDSRSSRSVGMGHLRSSKFCYDSKNVHGVDYESPTDSETDDLADRDKTPSSKDEVTSMTPF